MRDCNFCRGFWNWVYKYALLLVAATFAAMCAALAWIKP